MHFGSAGPIFRQFSMSLTRGVWNCSQPELKAYERAKASATASLALRSQSRQQLFEKLTDRGYDDRVVHRALDRLQEVVSAPS